MVWGKKFLKKILCMRKTTAIKLCKHTYSFYYYYYYLLFTSIKLYFIFRFLFIIFSSWFYNLNLAFINFKKVSQLKFFQSIYFLKHTFKTRGSETKAFNLWIYELQMVKGYAYTWIKARHSSIILTFYQVLGVTAITKVDSNSSYRVTVGHRHLTSAAISETSSKVTINKKLKLIFFFLCCSLL